MVLRNSSPRPDPVETYSLSGESRHLALLRSVLRSFPLRPTTATAPDPISKRGPPVRMHYHPPPRGPSSSTIIHVHQVPCRSTVHGTTLESCTGIPCHIQTVKFGVFVCSSVYLSPVRDPGTVSDWKVPTPTPSATQTGVLSYGSSLVQTLHRSTPWTSYRSLCRAPVPLGLSEPRVPPERTSTTHSTDNNLRPGHNDSRARYGPGGRRCSKTYDQLHV